MISTVRRYQKLTRGNINDMVAFYSTATGQKLLREMPAMMADAMQSMMPIMRGYAEKVHERVQEETAEMMKEGGKRESGEPLVKD